MAARAAGALSAVCRAALLLLLAFGFSFAAPVTTQISPGDTVVPLSIRPVVAGSEIVTAGADTLEYGRDYLFAPAYSQVILSRAFADTVYVGYQSWPELAGTVRRFAPMTAPVPDAVAVTGVSREPTFVEPGRFQIAGSKRLSLGIGDTNGGLIEQSLFLSIQGEFSSGLVVEGTISDQRTATDAITRRVSELDRLSLRAYGPGFASEFGDTELRQDRYKLFSLRRRISGLRAEGSYRAIQGEGGLGRRRGEYRTRRFYGEDGKQGPYLLSAGNQVAVVAGSESVWLDGELLVFGRERDYEIDYPTGTVTFMPRRAISRESRITVDYEIASEAYNSLVYEVGGGANSGGLHSNVLYHREWDDPDQGKTLSLLDSDRAALAGAGDSASLAVRSGIDSVGAGQGSYERDSSGAYFRYVGAHNGSFEIAFSYVGPGSGDYRARGDGSFFYAGAGAGDYAPVIALPLPGQTELVTVRAAKSWYDHQIEWEWAHSRRDLNRLSSLDDGDNSGDAFVGSYSFGSDTLPVSASAYWRHRSAQFRAPGRDRDVDYDRRWGRELGDQPGREDEYGSSLSLKRAREQARIEFSSLAREFDDRTWRSAAALTLDHGGRWRSNLEVLRRSAAVDVEFESGSLIWDTPLRVVPVRLKTAAERRVAGSGRRFGEVGLRVGPSGLHAEFTVRQSDSLEAKWQRHNDLYRTAAVWQMDAPGWSGYTQVHFERREFRTFQTGSEDRLLSESRWTVRAGDVTLRAGYRLSRAQAASIHEEFIPVDPGRGDYREEGGQYIRDSLGDLVRVVRTSSFGSLARQSEKQVNAVWQSPRSRLRAEVDLLTTESAANASLPNVVWLLPWQAETDSPERTRRLRADVSGGRASARWLWRSEWDWRLNMQTSRPEDYRSLQSEFTLRVGLGERWRIQGRAGGGDREEKLRFPYAYSFAMTSLTPAWRPAAQVELSIPAFGQRYWSRGGAPLADWQRLGVRAVVGIGSKGRIVAEPAVIRVADFGEPLPLEIADGRPVGTSAEWNLQGSLDLSKTIVGRLLYRGRAQDGRAPVHRADLSVEATF